MTCSLLYIETADRPGLLREIVKIITEINVAFRSGEFDTEVSENFLVYIGFNTSSRSQKSLLSFSFGKGLVAKAKFHVNYRGTALSKSMKQVKIYERLFKMLVVWHIATPA